MISLAAASYSVAVSTIAVISPLDSVSLSFTSDKAVYLKAESVKLTIVLENLSLRDV